MFCLLLLSALITLTASSQAVYCKQKAVPADVLSSFKDSTPNLKTGTVQITNSNLQSRYSSFNVSLGNAISNNYSLAVSLQNIHQFQAKDVVQFQVTALTFSTYFQGQLVMDLNSQWTWVSVSYLASGRPDFKVGNFMLDNAGLLSPLNKNKTLNFSYPLSAKTKITGSHLYSVPFVSAMRTYDRALSFEFTNAYYNSSASTLQLSLRVDYSKYPLESLGVSYLIFSMASDLEIISIYNIYFIPGGVTAFLGMSSAAVTASLFAQTTTSTLLKPVLQGTQGSPSQLQAFEQMFGIDGIMVQTQQSIDILYLPMQEVASSLSCVSKATCAEYGGEMVYEQTQIYGITSTCKICPANSNYSTESGRCVCKAGFVEMGNGSCLAASCSASQVYDQASHSCICRPLLVRKGQDCVSIFSFCPKQQIYFQGKCIDVIVNLCQADEVMVGRVCQKKKQCQLDKGFTLNLSTNECVCGSGSHLIGSECVRCGVDEVWSSRGCVCREGWFRVSGQCRQCSQQAFFDGTRCTCFRGYKGDGFTCTPDSQTTLEGGALSGAYIPGGSIQLP